MPTVVELKAAAPAGLPEAAALRVAASLADALAAARAARAPVWDDWDSVVIGPLGEALLPAGGRRRVQAAEDVPRLGRFLLTLLVPGVETQGVEQALERTGFARARMLIAGCLDPDPGARLYDDASDFARAARRAVRHLDELGTSRLIGPGVPASRHLPVAPSRPAAPHPWIVHDATLPWGVRLRAFLEGFVVGFAVGMGLNYLIFG